MRIEDAASTGIVALLGMSKAEEKMVGMLGSLRLRGEENGGQPKLSATPPVAAGRSLDNQVFVPRSKRTCS